MDDKRIFGRVQINNVILQQIKKLPSKTAFLHRLREHYDALRVYHGCRPRDVQSYDLHGFRPSDMANTSVNFDNFLKDIPYTHPYDITHVINSYSGSIDKFIYFILDREDFIDGSPHYIIYGSELMLSLAQNVDERLKFHLRQIGIPTIFHCDLPLSLIEEGELTPIYERIRDAKGNYYQKMYQVFSNYSIVVPSHVDSKYIVHHDHPTEEIYDVHAKDVYRNVLAACPICESTQPSIKSV
jgi:hypothetical protein